MITVKIFPHSRKDILDVISRPEFIQEVDAWLEQLPTTKRGKQAWRFDAYKIKKKLNLTFVRREDAVAFKIVFGL
jgi:hypothetical protein